MAGHGAMASTNNHAGNSTSQTVKANNIAFSALDKSLGNNHLKANEMTQMAEAMGQCSTSSCRQETFDRYKQISEDNLTFILDNCAAGGATGSACMTAIQDQYNAVLGFQKGRYDEYAAEDDAVANALMAFHTINLNEKDVAAMKAAETAGAALAESLGVDPDKAVEVGIILSAAIAAGKVRGNVRGNTKQEGVRGDSGSGPGKNTDMPESFSNQFPDHQISQPSLVPDTKLKNGVGTYNYVVLDDGSLVIGRKSREPGGGHIDLANGQKVKAAGEVKVIRGEIKYIDNTSGHYEPHGVSAQSAAEKAFKDKGFSVDKKYVEKQWVDNPSLPGGGSWRPVE